MSDQTNRRFFGFLCLLALIVALSSVDKNLSRHLIPSTMANHGTYTTLQRSNMLPNITTSSQNTTPDMLDLLHVHLLHMGKAGGTTVKVRLQDHWHLRIQECHPNPCSKAIVNKNHAPSNNTTITPTCLIPTLRDPVDRFVSAFYWRIERLCADVPRDQRVYGDRSGCQSWNKPNAALVDMLYHRRQKNASGLAADLCSTNDTTRAAAVQDVNRILHVKDKKGQNVVGWFQFDWSSQVDQIFPLVLEPSATDYTTQIDEAVHWLYSQTHFESDDAFVQRINHLRHSNADSPKNETRYRTSSDSKQPLTAAAERCMVQYYHKDYKMLWMVQQNMCKTTHCRQAIQHMLERRKMVFEGKSEEESVVG